MSTEGEPIVEVNANPEPENTTEPETNIEVNVETPSSDPPINVPVPSSDSGLGAYVAEHGTTHLSLSDRIKAIEDQVVNHHERHMTHDNRLGELDTETANLRSLIESPPISGETTESEPTIIPPDIPETIEEPEKPQHWLRKVGF